MLLTTENIILIGALLLLVSVFAGKVAYRFGAPALLLFLGVGMLFGLRLISFNSAPVAQFVGMVALCIILFSGGMDTRYRAIRPVIGPGVVLATVGVALTALIVAGFVYVVAPWCNAGMSFLLALLLMLLLVSQWHLLPASGREGSPFTAEGFKYIILPALTLGISGTASIARLTRSSVVAVLNEEFVMTLKAKGLRRKMILFKHILRNASLPILTMIGLDFGYLLGGAVVTETIFAWPGIGKYAMDAISQNDFPAVQGAVLILSMMFMLINLVVDLLYGVLDPRVSLE